MTRYASGGYIPSSGDRDDDRIPIMLSGCYIPPVDDDAKKRSELMLMSKDGSYRLVVLPPGCMVSYGDRQVWIAPGEKKIVLWDGDYKLLDDRQVPDGV